MQRLRVAFCLGLLGLAGCTSLGPATIRRDRVDFAEAIVDATKRETLLNIVKLRYADTRSLVSVSQLVAGYSLNGTVSFGTQFFDRSFNFSNDVNLGARHKAILRALCWNTRSTGRRPSDSPGALG